MRGEYNSINQFGSLKSWNKNGEECEKCHKDCSNNNFKKGETYEGVDIHHSPPQFMFEKDNWVGGLIILCRKCHREIHDKILEIMFKHSNLFQPKKSEHWTWIAIIGEGRIKCRDEVYEFTKRWLKDG